MAAPPAQNPGHRARRASLYLLKERRLVGLYNSLLPVLLGGLGPNPTRPHTSTPFRVRGRRDPYFSLHPLADPEMRTSNFQPPVCRVCISNAGSPIGATEKKLEGNPQGKPFQFPLVPSLLLLSSSLLPGEAVHSLPEVAAHSPWGLFFHQLSAGEGGGTEQLLPSSQSRLR